MNSVRGEVDPDAGATAETAVVDSESELTESDLDDMDVKLD